MVRFSGLMVEGEMLRVDGLEFWVELGGRLGGRLGGKPGLRP